MNRRIAVLVAGLASLALLAGCSGDVTPQKGAQAAGQAQTEQAFAQQQAAVPYPADQLRDSLERKNLSERLLRTNKPNAVGYMYLLSFSQPIGYYVIKGKVSSTQSQMTTGSLVVDGCNRSGEDCPLTVGAPGDDGSYGDNEQGVFFFTSEGTMVTTSLDYIWSDNVLPIDVPRLNK